MTGDIKTDLLVTHKSNHISHKEWNENNSLWQPLNCYLQKTRLLTRFWNSATIPLAFYATLSVSGSLGRPRGAVTLRHAVKLLTYFLRCWTDVYSLTMQSAAKRYYPPVIELISQQHPAVTGNVVQAPDRTRYRMWYHAAVSISVIVDTPASVSSHWLDSCFST